MTSHMPNIWVSRCNRFREGTDFSNRRRILTSEAIVDPCTENVKKDIMALDP